MTNSKLWLMITTLCFLGIFLAAMLIPAFSIILDGAFEAGLPDTVSTNGIVASHFNSMWYLGSFVGPIFGGILSEYMSFEWCTTLQGGILFVMAIILLASICSCKLRYTQPTEHASEEQNILSASTPQYNPTYDATGVHAPQ
uniref:Major facilitator superfamily (MFS) profile domain-containing protein n=1 Tax=Eptatretus burgeri TaxID=7764 RepID=A0A8C4QI41_EPTBU